MTAPVRTDPSSDGVLTIARRIAAPCERVFRAWIEPEHLVQWCYGEPGWTVPFAETDARPGGAFRIGMLSPDRKHDFVFEGIYLDVVEPERLVMLLADGRPVTVSLGDDGGGSTALTLDVTLETVNSEEQQRDGWSAFLDHLAEHLARA